MGAKEDLAQAKKLIKAKRYEDAQALLITIDHPIAEKWLDKISKLKNKKDTAEVQRLMGTVNKSKSVASKKKKNSKEKSGQKSVFSKDVKIGIGVTFIMVFALLILASVEQLKTDELPIPTPQHIEPATATPYREIYQSRSSSVFVRDCPDEECGWIDLLDARESVVVIGTVTGSSLNGSTTWYEVEHVGRVLYIHSSQIAQSLPTERPPNYDQPQSAGSSSGGSSTNQTQWNCSGNRYNCGDFSSCSAMRSYWNACPGDPSDLDGNNDGVPCESQC